MQCHAIWPVQCTSDLPEIDEPDACWSAVVEMPSVFG